MWRVREWDGRMLDAHTGWALNATRLRLYAGFAAAIVPFAIVVHLVAETAALGRAEFGSSFVVRHGYFGLMFALAVLAFVRAAGFGRPHWERRRRLALVRADCRGQRAALALATLVAGNLTFFALTQALEGVPVAAGAIGLSLVVALTGSVASAFIVLFFGHAIARAALDAVIIGKIIRCRAARLSRRVFPVAPARHATLIYSLLRPNRPPPVLSQL